MNILRVFTYKVLDTLHLTMGTSTTVFKPVTAENSSPDLDPPIQQDKMSGQEGALTQKESLHCHHVGDSVTALVTLSFAGVVEYCH